MKRQNIQPDALARRVVGGHVLYSHVVVVEARKTIFVFAVSQESLTLVFTASVVDFFSCATTHTGAAASASPTTTLALSLVIRCIAYPPLSVVRV